MLGLLAEAFVGTIGVIPELSSSFVGNVAGWVVSATNGRNTRIERFLLRQIL
jgi:hypothetical protein